MSIKDQRNRADRLEQQYDRFLKDLDDALDDARYIFSNPRRCRKIWRLLSRQITVRAIAYHVWKGEDLFLIFLLAM